MICRILLLIILTSHVWAQVQASLDHLETPLKVTDSEARKPPRNHRRAATFGVNVTQSSYQTEENHNITLEWTFTNNPHSSYSFIFILCFLLAPDKPSVLYRVHEGVEVSESQDEQFRGRVRSDKDVIREGRLRLHVSRLRTDDSGQYWCQVRTQSGRASASCQLRVSELSQQKSAESTAADPSTTQRPGVNPAADGRGRVGLYAALGLAAAALLVPLLSSLSQQMDWEDRKVQHHCLTVQNC